jgi:hypothetical protein
LGSVRIIHPFHPLAGKEFQVLKIRKTSGRLTLVLKENQRGSFAVPTEWTDYYDPGHVVSLACDAFISVETLFSLCKLVKKFAK